jgi:hypothetical protein
MDGWKRGNASRISFGWPATAGGLGSGAEALPDPSERAVPVWTPPCAKAPVVRFTSAEGHPDQCPAGTHNQSEALPLADQVRVIPDGTLAQVGTPSDVFRTPADLGVAEFAGAAVVVDADVVDGSVSPDPGPLHVMSGSDAGRA